ncbi:MAG: SBBP repeat-containing protein [Candidatus Sulfobium sp.]
MRQRGFLSVVVVASFFLIFVYPLNTGISSPIRSNEHVAYVAGAQSAQIGLHNEIIPLSGPGRGNDMLQFRAGGHVLGFQPNKVYLAGMDHALSVEFLGTKGVMPRAAADESNEIKAAPALQEVSYAGLWPGISVVYESARDGITESTYHLAPGADISKIRLRYNVPVERQKDGSLRFSFASGFVTESAPVAWQEIDGRRVPVEASFKVSKNEVGFSVAKYDARFPLIIDPIYQWNTFYGSSSDDYGNGIAVDGSGNVYVTGESYAAWGSPLNAYTGGDDIVILKLNSSGVLQWNTFYGSSDDDYGAGIAVDGSGNVYVTGESSATWGSPLNAYTGHADISVLKLSSSGALQWNTFYGSSAYEEGSWMAVDGGGNVYVTGRGNATWGSPLNAYTGGYDIVVLKVASSTPLPAGRQTFTYPPAASPGLSETLAGDMPIGVGSAANGGDTLGIRIGTHEFSSPVDMYVLFYFPEISPDIYSWTGSSFEPYSSSGLVPWKQSVTGPVDESLFGDLSVSGLGLPDGTYYLGLLVTPPGVSDLSLYYLWVTDFAVPQPAP